MASLKDYRLKVEVLMRALCNASDGTKCIGQYLAEAENELKAEPDSLYNYIAKEEAKDVEA